MAILQIVLQPFILVYNAFIIVLPLFATIINYSMNMCDLPFATVYHHFMRHDFNIYHTLPHSFPSVHRYLPSCNTDHQP